MVEDEQKHSLCPRTVLPHPAPESPRHYVDRDRTPAPDLPSWQSPSFFCVFLGCDSKQSEEKKQRAAVIGARQGPVEPVDRVLDDIKLGLLEGKV